MPSSKEIARADTTQRRLRLVKWRWKYLSSIRIAVKMPVIHGIPSLLFQTLNGIILMYITSEIGGSCSLRQPLNTVVLILVIIRQTVVSFTLKTTADRFRP